MSVSRSLIAAAFILATVAYFAGSNLFSPESTEIPDQIACKSHVDKSFNHDDPIDAENKENLLHLLLMSIGSDLTKRLDGKELERVEYEFAQSLQIPPIMTCFAPDTPEEIMEQVSAGFPWLSPQRYNILNRWTTTANGATGGTGNPITLTYSFVPDGTFIPNTTGFPGQNSNFQAWMNGIYGNQATWQNLFAQAFARWHALAGLTYVFEPNDDGVNLNGSAGQIGVRGDIRIGGMTLDGNSNTLAYNQFPNDGDMVFDTADGFFNSTSGNSIRLRNVIAHEHGHGMGLLHVCPFTGNKLMEPAVDTSYDGPQHDDIRAAQRNYGDPFEPDNSAGLANDLGVTPAGTFLSPGNVPAPGTSFISSLLSIDADSEQDYFSITTTSSAAVDVTVTPIGATYDSNQQQQFSCPSGNTINTATQADLAVQVIDTNGSSVVAEASANGVGLAEVITDAILPTPGTYFVRVYETGTVGGTQFYDLDINVTTSAITPAEFRIVGGVPTYLEAGQPRTIQVQVIPNDATITPGSERIFATINGQLNVITMTPLGGDLYEVTIPAPDCGTSPTFFFQFTQTVAGSSTTVRLPSTAPATPFSAIVTTNTAAFEDSGETDQGWTVSGTASDGQWDRGIPADGNRGDPSTDYDFSGSCWLTDNVAGNSDVDNGSTILTSPAFDMSNGGFISYAYWLNDDPGTPFSSDSLMVEIATNAGGTNWTQLRNYTTAADNWRTDLIDVGTEVSASSTMRIRFTATDAGTQTIVEAGIDAFLAIDDSCVIVTPPPPAPTGIAATDATSCTAVTVTWNAVAEADDYEVFRNSVNDENTAMLLQSGIVGTSYMDSTAVPGETYFYFVRGCNVGGGCGDFGTSDSGSRSSLPLAVTGLAATNQCGSVDLVWDADPGAFFYEVFRSTTDDFGTASTQGILFVNSFTDNTATPNQQYFYWVVVSGACGAGDEGNSVSGTALATPDAPIGVAASSPTCGTIQVTWNAAAGAQSYDVYRNTVDNFGSATFLDSTASLSYDDLTAPGGQTIFYFIVATNNCGDSAASASANTNSTSGPDVPANVSAASLDCLTITVSWDASAGADDYEVFRNTVDDFNTAASLGMTVLTSFEDATAVPATDYFYFVVASSVCGDSAESLSAAGSVGTPGDLNADGFINGLDLQGFVDAILTTGNPCADLVAPFGTIDIADRDAMVDLLLN